MEPDGAGEGSAALDIRNEPSSTPDAPVPPGLALGDAADVEAFFEKITRVAPTVLYVFDLTEMRNVWVNQPVEQFLGHSPEEVREMGENVLQSLMHPDDMARYGEHFERLRTLGPTETARFEYRMKGSDGSWRWLVSEDIAFARGPDDLVTRIAGSAHDITQAKEREERIELLVREMNHRVKNLFAVVGSMISLAGREDPALRGALKDVRARVNALALAHTISQGELTNRRAGLREIVRMILTPYEADHAIELTGDDPVLAWRATTPIGLIVHELATNAVKHGALGGHGGRLDVAIDAPDGEPVTLVWREIMPGSGPEKVGETPDAEGSVGAGDILGGMPRAKAEAGFGAVLMEQAAHQLGGTMRREMAPDGLLVTLSFPAASDDE